MITNVTQLRKPRLRLPYKWLFVWVSILTFFASRLEAQELVWARHMSGAGGDDGSTNDGDLVRGIAKDNDGNIYITGRFTNTVDFNPGPGIDTLLAPLSNGDAYLAKYDADGNYLWVRRIMAGGITNNTAEGHRLAVDADGNVFVAGGFRYISYFETGNGLDSLAVVGSQNAFLCKYSGEGDFIWIKGFPGLTGNEDSEAYDCAIGQSGAIYVAGTFKGGTTDFNPGGTGGALTSVGSNHNLYIAKYDATGSYLWAKGIQGAGQIGVTNFEGMSITIDATQNEEKLYITGMIRGGTFDFDPGPGVAEVTGPNAFFLAKYDAAGNYIWVNKAEPGTTTVANRCQGYDLAVDLHGNILVTGSLSGSADFDPGPDEAMVTAGGTLDMFLAKYNAEGNYIWAQATEGAGSSCIGRSLALDELGIVYVTGGFSLGAVDFDPGPGSVTLTPIGGFNNKTYIAKYGTCGSLLSVIATESELPSSSSGYGIVISENSNVYIAGDFTGNVDFDPGPDMSLISTTGEYNIFLTRFQYAMDSSLTAFLDITACGDSFVLNEQTYTESGTYQQWLPGTAHCDSFVVVNLTLNQIAEPIITVNGFELGVTNSYTSYQWIKDDEAITDATSSTYLVTENGDYQVTVSNEEGCMDTSVVYTVDNVRINDVNGLGKHIQIYPNPTSDKLYINSPVAVNALLYSIEGRLIIRMEQVRSLSLKGLANGLYLLQLTDKEGRTLRYEKIVCQPQ